MLAFLQNGFKPREARRTVMIAARMRTGAAWASVDIRNVSSRGLLLITAAPPAVGAYVEIRRGSVVIVGRTVWSETRAFGIKTQDRIDIQKLIDEPRLAARPTVRDAAEPVADRRSDHRRSGDAAIAERLERSRRLSSAFQFGLLVVGAGVIACIAATGVYDLLATPFAAVGNALAP